MKPRRAFIVITLEGIFLLLSIVTAQAFDITRGITIATWFTYPRYQPAPATGIEWPPYPSKGPSQEQLVEVYNAGFRLIRLAVDPAPLIFFEGQRRDLVFKSLLDAVLRLRAVGFAVIVDLHPNSRHPIWGDRALLNVSDTNYLHRYADLVEDAARRLASVRADNIALELVNEPRIACKGAEQVRWQEIVTNMVARARAASKTIPLIVSGSCGSTPGALIALKPETFDDPNVFYTFHYYEPYSFTHQGAQFITWPDKFLDQVPWPYSRRPIEEPIKALQERLAALRMNDEAERTQFIAARNNLTRYYAAKHDAQTIESEFSSVRGWATANNIQPNRVFVGEFGVWKRQAGLPGALCADRAAWITSVRQAAEKQTFGWVFFHFDGAFGLIDPSGKIDGAMLHALGLGPAAPCSAN